MTAISTWIAGLAVNTGQVVAPTSVNGFVFEVTSAAGRTGTIEPNWPLVDGNTVVDGTVTWTARTAQAITWTARALYKSGAVEPAWPVVTGETVADGTITWTCQAPNITDPKCPNTEQVRILASKVFAGRGDITRFCATNNPSDWSTADDAGFLPTGLHATGEVEVRCLAEYRGNLVVMTASDFQVWQVDPDPAQMQHLDTIPGLGTIYARGAASVASDLYFLTQRGVRSVGIASASSNLEDGDVGTPVDSLVTAALAGGAEPFAFYNPSQGEVWVVIGAQGFVYQRARMAKISAWSRDTWPAAFSDQTLLSGVTYLRAGDTVYRLDRNATSDAGTPFTGTIWWHYLDLGSPGVTKQLIGVDIVGTGACSIQMGYDQTNPAAYTPALTIGPDSVPGGMIPIPIAAPSMAPKLVYAAGQAWKFDALNLYLNDYRAGA